MAVKFWILWQRVALISAVLVATTSPARADVALDWNITMLAAIGNQPPFPTSRFACLSGRCSTPRWRPR